MLLHINGRPHEIPDGPSPVTVERLLREFLPGGAEPSGSRRAACAVEVNRRVVPKRDHASAVLADGDTIEVVTLVGGG